MNPTTPQTNVLDRLRVSRWLLRYGLAVVAAVAALGLRQALTAWLGPGLPTYITFYPMVMAAALLGGFGPGLVATLMSAALADYYVLLPVGHWTIASPVDNAGLAIFILSCALILVLTGAMKRAQARARDAEVQVQLSTERERLHRQGEIILGRLAAIVESSDDAIIGKDWNSIISSWNKGAEKIFGYTAGEMVGTSVMRLIPADRQDEENQILGKIRRGESVEHFETLRKAKNGRLIDVSVTASPILDATGNAMGVSKVLRDITERKRAEAALRENVEQLRLLSSALEAAANGIAITNRQGILLWVNPAFTTLTGYRADEAVGQNPRVLKSGKHDQAFYKNLWDTILDGRVWHGEIVNRCKDGTLYTEEMTITPVRANDGKIARFIAVKQDITERKRAEDEIRKLNIELEERVRLRTLALQTSNQELEAFCYSVSHDLRAPLRGIDGFSLALLEDYADKLDATGRDFLQRIRGGCQRMAQLIDDLLNLSRISRVEMNRRRIDLSKLARDVAHELRETAPERAVQFHIAEDLMSVGDHGLLRVALWNLLANAWKFTGKSAEAVIEFGVQQSDGRTTYFVRDNGPGFDMAYADKLFQPFQRLHAITEFPGSGIGLATVARVIHRHGGRIRAEAAPGRGATFYFTLEQEREQHGQQ